MKIITIAAFVVGSIIVAALLVEWLAEAIVKFFGRGGKR